MKHVIVIETIDKEFGGKEIYPELGRYISSRIEHILLNVIEQASCVTARYNVDSVMETVHKMFGVPNCQDRSHL